MPLKQSTITEVLLNACTPPPPPHRGKHPSTPTHQTNPHPSFHPSTHPHTNLQSPPLEIWPVPAVALFCFALFSAVSRSICSFCCVILVRALCSTLRDWVCFFSSSAVSACSRVFSACSFALSACCFCKFSCCCVSSCCTVDTKLSAA